MVTTNAEPKTTALVATRSIKDFPIMTGGFEPIAAALAENRGPGESLSLFDIGFVTMPTGKGRHFDVPTESGRTEPQKHIDGVILAWVKTRTYHAQSFEESPGTPPDCSSADMLHGKGEPGGPCLQCPYEKFGSAARSEGKACRENIYFFIAIETQPMPLIVRVTPGSLKAINHYMTRLSGFGKPHWSVVTRLSLETGKGKDGPEYAMIKPENRGALSPEEAAKCKALKGTMLELFGVKTEEPQPVETPAV